MSDQINEERISKAVSGATTEVEGRKTLSCSDALCIASELGVEPQAIGRICDENQVKIIKCQLGCFE